MKLIGRKKECDELNELLRVNRPQFRRGVRQAPRWENLPHQTVLQGFVLLLCDGCEENDPKGTLVRLWAGAWGSGI